MACFRRTPKPDTKPDVPPPPTLPPVPEKESHPEDIQRALSARAEWMARLERTGYEVNIAAREVRPRNGGGHERGSH